MRRYPAKFECRYCRYAASKTLKRHLLRASNRWQCLTKRHILWNAYFVFASLSLHHKKCVPHNDTTNTGTKVMHSLCKTYSTPYIIPHTVAHWILTFYPPFRPIIQYTCTWYVLHWHVNRVFISSPIYTHTQNDEELRFFSCDFISSVLVNSAWEVNDIVLSLLIQILIQISIASISTQRELITVLVSFWNQSVICPEYEKNRRFHVEYR